MPCAGPVCEDTHHEEKHTRLSNRDAAADAIQQNNLTERVRALLSGEGTDDDGEQGEAEAAEEF